MLSKNTTGRVPVSTARTLSVKNINPHGTLPTRSYTGVSKPDTTSNDPVKPMQKISSLHGLKVIDPMGASSHKTPFAAMYAKGGIPCRLQHGSVKHKLYWLRPIQEISFNPLMVVFFQGLIETKHPYVFIVGQGLKELMASPDAANKIAPVLSQIIAPLRCALAVKNQDQFIANLNVLVQLAALVGPTLLPYLASLLPPLASKAMATDMHTRESVTDALCECQRFLGDAAIKIIRSRIPTFSPLLL
ncbi:hypothetical protein BDV3_000576 [Batrachochytrium dendrobatidis]|uniref:PACRG-like protein n=2 Tax=Batrachochytrium dendrobatidis (strain JEL423) TaxID=403673 RepID=A0A177WDZ3_BATDL|nr:hypothetical protein BDEG_21605 [Batrachochytrium dendrobatidis JEL423]